MKLTKRNIEAALKTETGVSVELIRGEGYHYFSYEQFSNGRCIRYETYSVYTMYLNDLPLDRWMAEGREFIDSLCLEVAA
jgi:hypothetical protein